MDYFYVLDVNSNSIVNSIAKDTNRRVQALKRATVLFVKNEDNL